MRHFLFSAKSDCLVQAACSPAVKQSGFCLADTQEFGTRRYFCVGDDLSSASQFLFGYPLCQNGRRHCLCINCQAKRVVSRTTLWLILMKCILVIMNLKFKLDIDFFFSLNRFLITFNKTEISRFRLSFESRNEVLVCSPVIKMMIAKHVFLFFLFFYYQVLANLNT